MKRSSEVSRLNLRTNVFHTAFAINSKLPDIFHEMKPEIQNYTDLTYNIVEVEPVTSADKDNSVCFSVEGENYPKELVLLIATPESDNRFLFRLEYQISRMLVELTEKLGKEYVAEANLSIYLIYLDRGPFKPGFRINTKGYNSETIIGEDHYRPIHIYAFADPNISRSELEEYKNNSLLYEYWRFVEIDQECLEKYRYRGFALYFKNLRNRCLQEDIFPKFFNRKRFIF